MQRTLWIKLLFFIFSIGIVSCTTVTPIPSTVSPSATKLSWEDRERALNRIQSWQINGKIAVQTAQDSGSATVDWIQHHNKFTISLSGPLGATGLKLTGQQPGLVTLETADGKHYTAKSPEQLLAQRWGWNLPVSHLNYWVRGLPAPGLPSKNQFDPSHRLASLIQEGWAVQFLGYTHKGAIDLPDKIFITSAALKTKILIYSWKVE